MVLLFALNASFVFVQAPKKHLFTAMVGFATGVRTAMSAATFDVDVIGATDAALVVGTIDGGAGDTGFTAVAATIGGTAAVSTAGFGFKAFATGATVCIAVALPLDLNAVFGTISLLIVSTGLCAA